MATTAIAPMRSLLRVAGDVPCKQKKNEKDTANNYRKLYNNKFNSS